MPPEIIDWPLARRIGRAVAGVGTNVGREEAAAVAEDFRSHVEHADKLVRSFTGLEPLSDRGGVSVLSRGAWVDANLESVRALTRPLSNRIAGGFGRAPARRIGGALIAMQIGTLLGYVSQKVLGQYDLLLSSGEPGRVYFVGPNILAAERRSNLDARDFRLWIAIHEVTHRTQFLAVPWLKDHVTTLIERYLSGVTVDADRMKELARRIKQTIASGPEGWKNANLLSVFLTGEQRQVMEEMQALMSVVEGHGNFVMDGVAESEIPSLAALREALQARRATAGSAERAFQKLIALDLKYEQYAVGQSFFDDVRRLGGMEAVNAVWESPESLPSRDELRDADAWLRRVRPQPSLFDSRL